MNSFRQRKRPSVGPEEGQEQALEKPDLSKDDSTTKLEDGTEVSDSMNEQAQEMMKDNLELMHDIVMRIREDEEFASNIYANCPRLQHLLDQHPDLKPVFEDPILVRINFEQVYRDAGGVLPEDKPKKRSWLSIIVNHPLFKVLKFLLIIKKITNCVMGGGFAMIKGCFMGLCVDEAAELMGDGADVGEGGDAGGDAADAAGNPANEAMREQLGQAAEHMEDPEVQERMAEVLETNDPDQLAEMIENDPELRALRDSNALCAELMSDPDSMRILVDPDNLRALGDAPDLIEADFADPDWTPDDVEAGGLDTVPEVDVEVDADVDEDVEGEDEFDEENPEEEMDLEEEEGEGPEYELGDADNNARGGGGKKGNKKGNNNRGGGFMAQVGAGITDMVASELVGFGAGDVMGGDDGLGALEEAEGAAEGAEAAADAADNVESTAMAAAEAAEFVTSDGMDGLEDGLDELEDGADQGEQAEDNRNAQRAKAAGIGAAAGLGAYGAGKAIRSRKKGDGEEGEEEDGLEKGDDATEAEEEEEEEEPEKKGRFGFVGGGFSALATAAKEHVTTAILGDDFGEALVEKQEERAEKRKEEREKKKLEKEKKKAAQAAEKGAKEDAEKEDKGRRRMFGKKR